MESDTYRKIGRGGAGNYYSKQDLEEAARRAAEDRTTTPIISETNVPRSDYLYSGRGGAGNIRREDHTGATTDSSPRSPPLREKTEKTAPEIGYSGRGGAGNFRVGETEQKRVEAERRAKEAKDRAHEEVVRDVEMGLKPPERAHLVSERL